MTPRKVKYGFEKKNLKNPFFSVKNILKFQLFNLGTQMIDCRRWLSITSWSTIPIRWLSFWRIWRYDVLQYDVVYIVMPMHFRVLYFDFPNFFRIYKNPVKFQLTKFFRKTKKRKMHRHGRVRNFISVLLSHWTSKTIQASNWDSAPTQFYRTWCLQPVKFRDGLGGGVSDKIITSGPKHDWGGGDFHKTF